MKLKSILLCLQILVLGTILTSSSDSDYPYTMEDVGEIELRTSVDNSKEEEFRSLVVYPIKAFLSSEELIIQNTEPYYNLIIVITNISTGEEVYCETIPSTNSNYISIIISNLSLVNYSLTINNIDKGYTLIGYFDL